MFEIHHLALSVADLNASIEFYTALGFKQVFSWRSDDADKKIIHLKLKNFLLELFYFKHHQYPEKKSFHESFPIIGIKHFALKVTDLEQAREALLSKNIPIEIPITQGRTGINYFFISDPDGISIEVVQDSRDL